MSGTWLQLNQSLQAEVVIGVIRGSLHQHLQYPIEATESSLQSVPVARVLYLQADISK